jgi:hypothetical protein
MMSIFTSVPFWIGYAVGALSMLLVLLLFVEAVAHQRRQTRLEWQRMPNLRPNVRIHRVL